MTDNVLILLLLVCVTRAGRKQANSLDGRNLIVWSVIRHLVSYQPQEPASPGRSRSCRLAIGQRVWQVVVCCTLLYVDGLRHPRVVDTVRVGERISSA